MKKISFLVMATALVLGFMSCSNGSDDSTASSASTAAAASATASPATLEAATYKSADNYVVIVMSDSTTGTINSNAMTLNASTGKVTYTAGNTTVEYILKIGEKLYVAGSTCKNTSPTIYTTWTTGDDQSLELKSDNTWKMGTAKGTIENNKGIITVKDNNGDNMATGLYANKMLHMYVSEITKQ